MKKSRIKGKSIVQKKRNSSNKDSTDEDATIGHQVNKIVTSLIVVVTTMMHTIEVITKIT